MYNEASSIIAVIVPVFNAGKALKPCLRSILNQSFKQLKLVLVNDGSTDGSAEICNNFAVKDRRVTVIHQENKGSVAARKAGIFSSYAQQAKYIFISDADDILPYDALETLYTLAEQHQADCVCGNMRRQWKALHFPQKHYAPCFNIKKEEVYNNNEIIEKLYIGCFGISDFPVNLVAKLYQTELITKASDAAPIVRFIGDDLSVTLRVIPETKKLVITPKIVYNYRIGGGTSKFIPYMLDDFLALYTYKLGFAKKYPMNYDVVKLMNIELMNILKSYLAMCATNGGYNEKQILQEAMRICDLPLVEQAAKSLFDMDYQHKIGIAVAKKNYKDIANSVNEYLKSTRLQRMVKKLLLSI